MRYVAFELVFDLLSSAERFPAIRKTTVGSARVGEPGKISKIRPRSSRDDGRRSSPAPRRINSRRSAPWQLPQARKQPEPTAAGFRAPLAARADSAHCSPLPPEHGLMSVAFCAAMPRCLSKSSGLSLTRRARINALSVGQIDRTDGNHLHR
jgi:hypothetical protein